MRICVRLAVMAGMLVAVAMALVALRTDVHQAGHRLHALFREKRSLERQCCALELRIARLRSQQRLRDQAADLRRRTDDVAATADDGPDGAGSPGRTVDDRSPPGPP